MDFKKAIQFLAALKKNNHKEWFDEHRDEWQDIRSQFVDFLGELITEIARFDPEIRNIEPKDCMFRINKDVRFSKDKSPYKTNIGALISKGGKKGAEAGYYIHIEPNGSFAGGGIYNPDPLLLKAIRQEVDYNAEAFVKIIKSKNYIQQFGGITGEKLANPPKGYDAENPTIEYIKMKSFLSLRDLSNAELNNKDILKNLAKTYQAMKPLNDFLNQAVASEK